MKMLIDQHNDRAADPSLLRAIVRAHDIQSRLAHNTKLSVHDIAREERVTAAYIYTLLRLPWLAPDITTAINGRQPPQLNAKKLMRLTARLSSDWVEQRALLASLNTTCRLFELLHREMRLSSEQKSQPRNGPAEIFCQFPRPSKIAHTSALCLQGALAMPRETLRKMPN